MTEGGGFGNAIVGTLVIVAIATVISVPLGILGAIYIADFGPDSKIAAAVQFAAKVLTGLPSILAGVFAFATVVVVTGGFSAPAGGAALALLMLPTILLTAEEAIKRVPSRMREAAIGMGATPTQVVTKVILPTAFPRNPDRNHAGARTRRRGNGAVAVHLALQRILDEPNSSVFPAQDCERSDEADCVAGGSYLQFFRLAVRKPDCDGLVGGTDPGRYSFSAQFHRPFNLQTLCQSLERITKMSAAVVSPSGDTQPGDTLIDCNISELHYGKFKAVRDVAVKIGRGTITAFIGPSGCGKSTALRCLNRMNDLVRGFRLRDT